MTTIKKVFWALVAVIATVVGVILLGKSKKLKKLEIDAKVNKANAVLTEASTRYIKSKEDSHAAVKKYRTALSAYRKHRDS